MIKPVRVAGAGGLLLAGLALVACGGKEGADYCLNHYLTHAEHQATVTMLRIDVSNDGSLTAILTQPVESFAKSVERQAGFPETLTDPEHVYSIAGRDDCVHSTPRVSSRDGVFVAEYASQCGQGAALKLVNVSILESVPEIDEVEVTIQTPATSKHFAISRQCAAPIFRLGGR